MLLGSIYEHRSFDNRLLVSGTDACLVLKIGINNSLHLPRCFMQLIGMSEPLIEAFDVKVGLVLL